MNRHRESERGQCEYRHAGGVPGTYKRAIWERQRAERPGRIEKRMVGTSVWKGVKL